MTTDIAPASAPDRAGISATAFATLCTAVKAYPAKDQDAVASIVSDGSREFQLALVADGLGSSEGAGEASRWLVLKLTEVFDEETPPDLSRLHDIIKMLRDAYLEELGTPENIQFGGTPRHATTLIVCLETTDEYHIAYLGNGAILHLRPQQFAMRPHTPWYAVNLLNPHSQMQDGKEALTRFFSPDAGDQTLTPTLLTLRKDAIGGEILILCTDGIFSQDSVTGGEAANGRVYHESSMRLTLLYNALKGLGSADNTRLQAIVDAYLDTIHPEKVDDDTGIAVLFSPVAVSKMRELYPTVEPPPLPNTATEAPQDSGHIEEIPSGVEAQSTVA